MKNFFKKNKKGFAMLFTVLVVSLMLAIGLGISDLTFKQTILSSLAQGSQLAFYQADSGVECGVYYAQTKGEFPLGTVVAEDGSGAGAAPKQLACGGNTIALQLDQSYTDYFVYQEQVASGTTPCFSITFDNTTGTSTTISARGFSTCSSTPQQVERGLSVTY